MYVCFQPCSSKSLAAHLLRTCPDPQRMFQEQTGVREQTGARPNNLDAHMFLPQNNVRTPHRQQDAPETRFATAHAASSISNPATSKRSAERLRTQACDLHAHMRWGRGTQNAHTKRKQTVFCDEASPKHMLRKTYPKKILRQNVSKKDFAPKRIQKIQNVSKKSHVFFKYVFDPVGW